MDPGDANPVQAALIEKGRELTGILVTHHHPDHIGGIKELIRPGMPVIGPAQNPYALVNTPVREGDHQTICGVNFSVLEVPGHTLNHLAYFAEPEGQKPILFSGDTLFAGGCGRLFEGTPEQMHHSLGKLACLPSDTQVYCAHEYTLANLAFALHLEPGNILLTQHQQEMASLRDKGIPTVPTSIEIEKQINPFLRVDSQEICQSARQFNPDTGSEPTEIFATIRKMKDAF